MTNYKKNTVLSSKGWTLRNFVIKNTKKKIWFESFKMLLTKYSGRKYEINFTVIKLYLFNVDTILEYEKYMWANST